MARPRDLKADLLDWCPKKEVWSFLFVYLQWEVEVAQELEEARNDHPLFLLGCCLN